MVLLTHGAEGGLFLLCHDRQEFDDEIVLPCADCKNRRVRPILLARAGASLFQLPSREYPVADGDSHSGRRRSCCSQRRCTRATLRSPGLAETRRPQPLQTAMLLLRVTDANSDNRKFPRHTWQWKRPPGAPMKDSASIRQPGHRWNLTGPTPICFLPKRCIGFPRTTTHPR